MISVRSPRLSECVVSGINLTPTGRDISCSIAPSSSDSMPAACFAESSRRIKGGACTNGLLALPPVAGTICRAPPNLELERLVRLGNSSALSIVWQPWSGLAWDSYRVYQGNGHERTEPWSHGTNPHRDCCTRDRRFAAGRRAVDAGLVGGVRWRGLEAGPDSAKSASSAVSG